MLNEEFKKYEELYSELITSFANLHNKNSVFVKDKGRDIGFSVRKHLREIENLAKQLKRQCQLVNKESIKNNRLEKIRAREAKKNRKTKKKDVVS